MTVTAPPSSAPSTSTAAPAEQVVIPGDLVGQNGAIAYDQLQQLGFSNVQLASRDAGSKVVLNPANWTVTKVDPKPGTKIMSNRTVVVTMTKE